MHRTDVSFAADGVTCSAWFYAPDDASRDASLACVVMAHGFSCVRDQRLDAFAERFAAAGYAVLVFDYRHFGDSEGEPRQLLHIGRQLADWRAAIAFARSQPQVDPERIVAWGTSFSGGHSLSMAAQDHRLAAAIAQGPFMDGLSNVASYGPRQVALLTAHALRDVAGAAIGRAPHMLAVTGPPGSAAAITTPDAVAGFASITSPGSTWRNEVAARIGLQVLTYRPVAKAAKVRCPVLFCIAGEDVVTPVAAARKAAARVARSEVKDYPGAKHFDVYVGECFDEVVTDQLDFLKRHVG